MHNHTVGTYIHMILQEVMYQYYYPSEAIHERHYRMLHNYGSYTATKIITIPNNKVIV